jgi:hypothetical protein
VQTRKFVMMSPRSLNRRAARALPAVCAAILMVTGPGCASLDLFNFKDKVPTADAEHPAIEVLAIWQAAEGPGLGGVPTRGFAGQIFFFTQDRAQPVAVDGKARIYVFDDHGTVEQQARPLRQFDFDRQSWTAHLQSSKLGPTYGVFIPYPSNDYHQAVCSLRVRFTPMKGRPLYSQASTIVLPGPPAKSEPETAQATPLDNLAKKLQTRTARTWSTRAADTEPRPLSQNSQFAAAQPAPASVATPDAPEGVTAASYSTAQSPASTTVNPIVQTGGTMAAAPPAPAVPPSNSAGYATVGQPDAVAAPGPIKLEPISADTEVTAERDEAANSANQPPPNVMTGPPVSRPRNPLAD